MKNKHPYYDSDRKQRSEEFAYQAIGICMITLFAIYIVSLFVSAIT